MDKNERTADVRQCEIFDTARDEALERVAALCGTAAVSSAAGYALAGSAAAVGWAGRYRSCITPQS